MSRVNIGKMKRPSAAFWLAAIPLLGFAVSMLAAPEATTGWVGGAFGAVTAVMGWGWQVGFALNVVLAALLAASPLGALRLGEGTPQLSRPVWVAIILCTLLAGGGVFWSAAEPLYHFQVVPPAFTPGVEALSQEAAVAALAQSHAHWGTLAWSCVGTLGVIAVVAAQRLYGEALRPRALLSVVLGRRCPQGLGAVADAVSIVAVVAGTVGPIGFLALQLSGAGQALVGIPDGLASRLTILALLVGVYTVSAASGVQRGIAWLSRLNVALTLALGAAVLLPGNPTQVIEILWYSLVIHGTHAPQLALGGAPSDAAWLSGWTWFYWGWFLGYGPLMALFVARISRGRSVRELVVVIAILAPLLTHIWFATLGGTGLALELATPGEMTGPLKEQGLAGALLAIVSALPGAALLVAVMIGLVFCFLATTGDSMAYTIASVLSDEEEPLVAQRVFWGVAMGVLAATLVTRGGDAIDALQRFIVLAAVPVTPLMAATLIGGPLGAWRLWRLTRE